MDVLQESHEEVADILRQLRATSELPVFQLYRYPLIQGFQQFVNEDTDSEKDDEDLPVKINGISQQLDFSLMSSEGTDGELGALDQIAAPVPPITLEYDDEVELATTEIAALDEVREMTPEPPKAPVIPSSSPRQSPVSPPEPAVNARLSPLPPPNPVNTAGDTDQVAMPVVEDIENLPPTYMEATASPPPEPLPIVTEPPAPPVPVVQSFEDSATSNGGSGDLGSDHTRASPEVRTKAPSVQINYQSPKPFKSPDQLVIRF